MNAPRCTIPTPNSTSACSISAISPATARSTLASPTGCRASSTPTATPWYAIWRSSRATATPSTPGGLRDYQLVCWLGQLREGAADPSAELREAYHFLARLRCYLHIQSGRDNNLLTFDAQDALAEHWRLPDAAQWMREYYRHARAIYRAAIRQLEEGEFQTSSDRKSVV